MAIPPPKVYGTKLLSNQDLDELALTALVARWERVEKSQIGKLLEYLEATDEFTLLAYLVRQAARGAWSRRRPSPSASRLFRILRDLAQRFNDEVTRRDALRRALGYLKWFYESWELNRNVLNNLSRKYANLGVNINSVMQDPRQRAPNGFAKEYLEALLGL